jgi:aminopeptidase N
MGFERLSASIVPLHYHIRLCADILSSLDSFNGQCFVILKAMENIDMREIVLHALEMEFNAVKVAKCKELRDRNPEMGEEHEIEGVEMEQEWEIARIKLKKPMQLVKDEMIVLWVDYSAKWNKTMRGFYRSEWKGQKIGTTQFEPTDARRAFPCWDEPSFKATFSVDIEAPGREFQVISNMPVLKMDSSDKGLKENHVLHQFYKSPIMSTYLVAFVIGKFDFISAMTKKGVEVRIFAMPGKINQAEFALNVAVKAMDFFVDFFGIDYPLVRFQSFY